MVSVDEQHFLCGSRILAGMVTHNKEVNFRFIFGMVHLTNQIGKDVRI